MTNKRNIGIEDARKQLGPLVDQARTGADIVLTRHGRPIARIVPIEEPAMPTAAESIATYRRFAIVPTVVDTLGIEDRSPGLMDLGRAQITYEAQPFKELINDIDAFFGDELDEALTGPESDQAEAEARRIFAEHLAGANKRLTLGAALVQVDCVNADVDALQHMAALVLQRAADRRFVEIVSPAVA